MTEQQYLDWIQTNTATIARTRYQLTNQQLAYQLGLAQAILARLASQDSHNTHIINRTFKQLTGSEKPYKP